VNAGRRPGSPGRHRRWPAFAVRALLVATAAAVPSPRAASADSDFWDRIREPGLSEYRQEVEAAWEAFRARRFDEAIATAKRAVDQLPERPEAHVVLALACGEAGRLRPAIDAIESALEADPAALDDLAQGVSAAELAATAGSYDLARRILARLVGRMESDRRRARLYVLYGDVLLTLGPRHLSSAVAAYREAMRHQRGDDPRLLLGLALALRRAGSPTEAMDLARRAAERGHFDARLRTVPIPESEKAARRALALLAIGDQEGARRAFGEAAEGPWRAHALSERGGLRRGGGG